jgi:Bifunctional DNA primase/polymerase, N-terminal
MRNEGGALPGTPHNANTARTEFTSAADTAASTPASMLGWALAYAKQERRPVFPCDEKPGDHAKAPYTEHGHKNATTDPKQICDWWIRWPDALIGSPVPSHLICLDIDPRHGGTIEAVMKVFGELPETEFVMSGRGDRGAHLFYLRPTGFITASVLKKVCPGVDIKLDTGYTILPPSPHADSGMPYQWGGPEAHADLPETVRKVRQPPVRPYAPGSGTPNPRALEGILRVVAAEKGTRNNMRSGHSTGSWRTATRKPRSKPLRKRQPAPDYPGTKSSRHTAPPERPWHDVRRTGGRKRSDGRSRP